MTNMDSNAPKVDLEFLREEFNRFRAELAGMKDRLGGNANDALDKMAGYLSDQGVSSKLRGLESEIENLASRLRDTGKESVAKLETQVSSRPIASIALAFGVGLLTAQMLRKS